MKPVLYRDFFYRNALLIEKTSNIRDFRMIRALIASESTFEILNDALFSYFLIVICISFYTIHLTCHVWGILVFWVCYSQIFI